MNKYDKSTPLRLLSTADTGKVAFTEDMAVFTTDRPFDTIGYPLRFDGLVIALVREGEGSVGIDLRDYQLRPDSLMVIHPRNYIYSARGDGLVIDVVACSRQVVENVLPKLTDLMPLLMHHRSEPVENLSEHDARTLRMYHHLLLEQYEAADSPFRKKKMMCLLQSALFEMMDIQSHREEVAEHRKTRKEEIMARFILLVSENFREQRQIGFYSDQLCVSSKHLSSVVKEISGRTAGDWIENYVTVEAKVLLRTTDLPIQEIASRLHFTNQSFFGKYFKHQTGMSPSEYRKSEL